MIKGGYKEFFESYRGKCEPQAYVEMLHGDFTDVCRSTASMVRRSWRRHKSFDTNVLRHSSPALLPSGSSTNIGGGCDGPKRRSRKRTDVHQEALGLYLEVIVETCEVMSAYSPKMRKALLLIIMMYNPEILFLMKTSYSEGCDNIVVRFDGRCDDRNQAEEREQLTLSCTKIKET